MEFFYRNILEFCYGIRDSLRIHKVFEFILISRTIKDLFLKTFFINGILFLGSMFFLRLCQKFFSSDSKDSNWSEVAQTVFSVIYYVFYLIPLYLISFIYNSFYYADIATEAINIERQIFRNRGINQPQADVLTRIYNEVINALVLIFFILQSFIISYIPYIGSILYLFNQSFMYAFFCFTYKWGTDQVDLYKIIAFFDKYFSYFAGFGFVYAVITRIFPGLTGSGVYALLFPIFLLLSIKASPPKDLDINDNEKFVNHLKLLFKKDKNESQLVTYDNIDTFNYDEVKMILKAKIGIFTFPQLCIKFVGDLLKKKLSPTLGQ